MGINLANIAAPAQDAEPLTIIEQVTHAGRTLAVAETSTRDLVLVCERERGALGSDGKRSRENGTERYWKRSSRLADFAAALESGLIAT